jgi:hypothetical protein
MSTALVRTTLLHELGGFCESLHNAEDWDLWIRLAESHRVEACREPLVRYRFHGAMKSGNPVRMQLARRAIIMRGLQLARGLRLTATMKRRVIATMARTNGSDAARHGATQLAWQQFGLSALAWPFDVELYRCMARLALSR